MVYADHRLILVSGHLFLETLGVSGRDQRPDRRIVELIDGTVVDQGLFCRGKFLVQPIFIHDLLHGLSHLRVLLAGYTHGIPLDERDIPVSVEILYLEQQFGFEVTYLPVDSMGHISLEDLKAALRPDTILVSTMMVNNEIGSVLDIEGIGKTIKEYDPAILYHVDAIQAYGKRKIAPAKLKIDLLSVSGHKIHGPKGTGFLYVADGVKMHPIIHGGGQQNGRRSGTQNVPGIAGLGLAAKKMYEDHLAKVSQMYECKAHLIQKLEEIDKVAVHAVTPELRECAPHVVSASFEGVGSEVLLHALEDRGIYVSSGSACSSNHPGISSTLQAIGVPDKLLESTIRFSFSVYTTIEELDYTVEQLKELLPVLRRYVRR